MARKRVLLFDSTWNKQDDRTNVVRMKEAIAGRLAESVNERVGRATVR